MKNKPFSLFLAGIVVLGIATSASAQITLNLGTNDNPITVPSNFNPAIMSESGVFQSNITQSTASAQPASSSLGTFTLNWTASKDGNMYPVTIVGRSPFLRGKLPTHTTVPVIPVIITFTATGDVFNPLLSTACTAGHTVLELAQNSPIFTPYPFTINGVNVGPAQYIDASQRAEFWSLINGANYHTILDPTFPGTVSITVGSSVGFVQNTGCTGKVGFIEINAWDAFLQSTIIPAVQTAFGVNATQFPLFLLSNVYWFVNTSNNCCVLGYHNAYQFPIQSYSPTTWDSSGIFGIAGQDSAVMSHEVSEWANDPYVNNPTPAWGNIGQVGGCQGNFETGDPLTGNQVAPVLGVNGFTYHLQELGFFSWYYNALGDPSLGAGGKYSGGPTFAGPTPTFNGPSKVCPPGGTN